MGTEGGGREVAGREGEVEEGNIHFLYIACL